MVKMSQISPFLQDVNDQVPTFSEDVYEVNVTENTAVGASLLTVTASDGDIGENAAVLYSVSSDSVVTVDGDSGEVVLGMMVDYETSNRLEIEVYCGLVCGCVCLSIVSLLTCSHTHTDHSQRFWKSSTNWNCHSK